MRINITSRRFRLSDDLKDYTEKTVRRLKKYYEPIIDVDIVLGWEKKDRMAEINISVYGTILSAHERSEDMRKSIDRAVDKLERQLKKYKDRRRGFEHEKMPNEQLIAESNEP
jgi:putative sigma-54 modulation protein